MGVVFSKLPTFAADYSGAEGVFYDMDGICVTCDAGSCAASFFILDEPRLFQETKKVFTINLREKDVVLGVDKRLKKEIKKTYELLGGECISFFGTPVPTVIGMDFKGLAKEIEKELGIPVFGIDSTGLDFYDVGQTKAYDLLLDYCKRTESEKTTDVNVIGATPLDMWDLNQIKDVIALLKEAGAENPIVWGANGKLPEIAGANHAKLNIAVSASAIPIVKKMHKEFGIPYIVGYPIGAKQTEVWKKHVETILSGNEWKEDVSCVEHKEGRVLIVGEQISSNSVRDLFEKEFGYKEVDVVSYFQMYEEFQKPNDKKLVWESDFTELLMQREKYDVVIADPLYFSLLPYKPDKMIMLPDTVVSSRAFWDKSPNCFGPKGSLFFGNFLK